MKLYKLAIIFYCVCIFSSFTLCQDEPDVNVKIIPANHFRMQKSDLSRLKQELEHNMKKRVALLEDQWTANEKLRERSSGVWNLRGSPMITPTQYGGPQTPQPWYLANTVTTSKSSEEDDGESEKIADKLAKQLYMVNQAINQLKTSIDDSKRNLGNPVVKEVKTVVHTPTKTDMTAPRFEENTEETSANLNSNASNSTESSQEPRFKSVENPSGPMQVNNNTIAAENFFKEIFEEKEFKDMAQKLNKSESLVDLETPENLKEYKKENERGIEKVLDLMMTQNIKPESSYLEEGMKQFQKQAQSSYTNYVKKHKDSDDFKFNEKENKDQNGPVAKPKDPSIAGLLKVSMGSKKDTPRATNNGPLSSNLPLSNGAVPAGYSYIGNVPVPY